MIIIMFSNDKYVLYDKSAMVEYSSY